MKSIVLIHTVQCLAVSFSKQLQNFLQEEVKIHSIWDDFLATNPNEIGEFSLENRNRLFHIIKAAELTHADIIVSTCSTLTPAIKLIRPFIKTPIIAIDDAITRKAAKDGNKILVLATAESAANATQEKIQEEASLLNKPIDLHTVALTEAFQCLKNMDMERHDEIIKNYATSIKGFDCIVLAQASMAHLEKDIAAITNRSVLSSPILCMQEIKNALQTI